MLTGIFHSGNGIGVVKLKEQALGVVIDVYGLCQLQRHESLVSAPEDRLGHGERGESTVPGVIVSNTSTGTDHTGNQELPGATAGRRSGCGGEAAGLLLN